MPNWMPLVFPVTNFFVVELYWPSVSSMPMTYSVVRRDST